MNRIVCLFGLCMGVLLIFFATLLFSKTWLSRSTHRYSDALHISAAQFEKMLALAGEQSPSWNQAFKEILEDALQATITVTPVETFPLRTSANEAANDSSKYIIRDRAGKPQAVAIVNYFLPSDAFPMHHRFEVASYLMALGLFTILSSVVLIFRSRQEADGVHGRFSPAHAEVDSLARLAQMSVKQGAELEFERAERLRIQEDLHFQQVLLNRALEEKIRLGYNLHDDVIQSLYATGLALEAAKVRILTQPVEAIRQLDAGVQTLNSTIRDVRNYIAGLDTEDLTLKSFEECVRSVTENATVNRKIDLDLRIDSEAALRLNSAQLTDLLQIIREALSNSLRHGAATQVTIRLHEGNGELCLLIQDNGKGFNVDIPTNSGHGLHNMRARARRVGAQFRCVSSARMGTRLVFTIPTVATIET